MNQKIKYLDKLLEQRVLLHVLFWLFALFIAPFTSDQSISELKEAFVFRAVAMPTKITATYLLAYYQLPKLFYLKKYTLFALSFLASSFIFSLIYRFNNVHIAEAWSSDLVDKESIWLMIQQYDFTFLSYFPRVYAFTIIFIFIKMIRGRAKEKKRLEALIKEKSEAELNFLKAQIHPHFLFNTLNNLYALTVMKSDKAPDVVAKLSEILDYMLYQCKGDKVPLNKEIELLENYIALEKLRYGDRLQVLFETESDQSQTFIAPLILVSFVENAFKHGVSGTIEKASIEITLVVKNNEIRFNLLNSKPKENQKDEMNYKEGIGLKNVQKQLDLIYPEKYHWEIDEQAELYKVALTLKA